MILYILYNMSVRMYAIYMQFIRRPEEDIGFSELELWETLSHLV